MSDDEHTPSPDTSSTSATHARPVIHEGLPTQLPDIDPDETTDLAGQANMATIVLAYARKMLDWRLRHADRTLTNMALTKDGVFSRP